MRWSRLAPPASARNAAQLGLFLLTTSWSACAPHSSARPPSSPKGLLASEERVSFPAKDLELVGALSLPEREPGERLPAVVFIAGSGPAPAHCQYGGQLGMNFGFSIPVCRDIAEALREAGIATLLYDKRACGPFNHCSENGYPVPSATITIEDEVQDVRAAIDMLRMRSDIDPERIVVVGQSLGGTFVPELLRTDASLAGGVMLAAAFQEPDIVLRDQARLFATLVAKGPPSEAADQAAASLAQSASDVSKMLDGSPDAPQQALGAPRAYWMSWFELAQRVQEQVHEVEQPLLIMAGDYDFNVSTTELELWRTALKGRSNARVEKLQCVTHVLNCILQPNPFAIQRSDIGAHVSDSVLASLTRFVEDVAR
jgi:alpha-beta hydrolase superfamily lysophospholipase